MPKYRIETNQGTFEIEANREPTQAEIEKLVSEAPPVQAPSGADPEYEKKISALRPAGTFGGTLDRWKLFGDWMVHRGPKSAAKNNDAVAEGLIQGVPAAAGAWLGAQTGPAAPVAAPALASAGSAAGDTLVQWKRNLMGQQQGYRPGQTVGAAIAGAVPAGRVVGPAILSTAGKYALGNLAGKTAETMIDQGRAPTLKEAGMSAGMGALGAPAQRVLSRAERLLDDPLYALRDKAFRDLRPEGVKVPMHEMDRGSSILSGIGGKTALQQQAARDNQPVWNRLTREEVGLKGALPIRLKQLSDTGNVIPGDMDLARQRAYAPYEEIKAIAEKGKADLDAYMKANITSASAHGRAVQMNNPQNRKVMDPLIQQAAADVDALKIARANAHGAFKDFQKGDPESYQKYVAFNKEAETLEGQIRKAADSLGDKTLVDRLDTARTHIAKTWAIERATDPNGLVDPMALARQLKAGVPLTGNLRKIASFAWAFSREAREATRVPAPGPDHLSVMMGALSAAQGNPAGFMAGGLPLVRGPVRDQLLGDRVQNWLAQPRTTQPSGDVPAMLARFSTQAYGR